MALSGGCLVRPGLQGPLEVGGRSRLSWTTNQREACLVTSILNVTILTDDGGEIYGHLELTSGSIEHFGWQGRIRFDPIAPAGAVKWDVDEPMTNVAVRIDDGDQAMSIASARMCSIDRAEEVDGQGLSGFHPPVSCTTAAGSWLISRPNPQCRAPSGNVERGTPTLSTATSTPRQLPLQRPPESATVYRTPAGPLTCSPRLGVRCRPAMGRADGR